MICSVVTGLEKVATQKMDRLRKQGSDTTLLCRNVFVTMVYSIHLYTIDRQQWSVPSFTHLHATSVRKFSHGFRLS